MNASWASKKLSEAADKLGIKVTQVDLSQNVNTFTFKDGSKLYVDPKSGMFFADIDMMKNYDASDSAGTPWLEMLQAFNKIKKSGGRIDEMDLHQEALLVLDQLLSQY